MGQAQEKEKETSSETRLELNVNTLTTNWLAESCSIKREEMEAKGRVEKEETNKNLGLCPTGKTSIWRREKGRQGREEACTCGTGNYLALRRARAGSPVHILGGRKF